MKNKKLKLISDLEGNFNHTFLNGIYLAINAIKDAYLLIDCPPFCGYDKINSIQWSHDFFSQLLRRDGKHKICCSGVSDAKAAIDRSSLLQEKMRLIMSTTDCGVLCLTSMPSAKVLAIDYDQLIRKINKDHSIPIVLIESCSMDSDWLTGFENTLLCLAKSLNFRKVKKKLKKVGIVGYLFDRNEGDQIGNIFELKRIFEFLDLNLTSIWLSGGSIKSLKSIEEAQTIISLPYGRKAAREIAKATGAQLLELDLPFGLKNTENFIKTIARHFNSEKKAQKLIDQDLSRIIPILSCVTAKYFMNKTFSVCTDPFLAGAIASSLKELGSKIQKIILFSKIRPDLDKILKNAIFEPRYSDVFNMAFTETEMIVCNSQIKHLLRTKNKLFKFTEIGYPSVNTHFLTNRPFLGLRGFVNFINQIINNSF